MTEFQQQLKDPRWQKKRLEIMERDEWTCQMCGDTEATLTVHHKSYKYDDGKFADIWDYEESDLVTLCMHCHTEEETILTDLSQRIYFLLRDACHDSQALVGFVRVANTLKNDLGRRVTEKDLVEMVVTYSVIKTNKANVFSAFLKPVREKILERLTRVSISRGIK